MCHCLVLKLNVDDLIQPLLHPTHICSALLWLLAQENTVASGFAVVKVEVEEEKWIMGETKLQSLISVMASLVQLFIDTPHLEDV
ncbi:hypothetical protein KOW79_011292 [Hemibagrus wyckioides]|uniref:Uncharacterized protein n=1 Tax=Hemibagrus wyckioides TaxID=337641 RepID=A0A9D3NLW7_9TELE|nr:hypothetical protein KOW79_011292 [Hemibagrus wyckioides]